MVLATDGISSGFAGAIAEGGTAQDVADRILAEHGKAVRRRARRRRALPAAGMTALPDAALEAPPATERRREA